MSIGDFFNDVGDFGKAVVTGRWSGGENSIGDVWNRDPAAVLAPLALAGGAIAAPFALGGEALAVGGAAAGAETIGAGGAATAGGIEALGGGGSAIAGLSPEVTGAFASAAPESMAAPLSLTPAQTVAGDFSALGGGNLGTSLNPEAAGLFTGGGGAGGAGAPMSLAPAASAAGGGSFLSGMGVTNPWALGGAALSGVGLASNLMRGDSHPAAQDQASNTAKYLQNEGTALTAEGQQLQKYLASGTLPPALKSQVDQALRAEKARIISGHASKGLSTNPTQNSALAQELSAAERNALNLAGDLETKLFESGNKLITTGLNATGLSGQMYQWLTTQDKQDQGQVSQALANFAASLGGVGSKGSQVNLKLT